jgi:GntR family transcriptional regulator, rspAB operon transcriptional repressor
MSLKSKSGEPHLASEQAYQAIVDLILTRNLRAGERTSANLLADRLGFGRTPIKEAITRLEAEGLLTVAGRSGTTVRAINAEETQQLFALRRLLEDFAAGEAVKHVRTDDIRALKELLREMRQTSLVSPDFAWAAPRFIRANVDFHAVIIGAARNSFLDRLYAQIQMQLQIVTYLMHRGDDRGAAAIRQKEHEQIVKSLERGDASSLRHLLKHHAQATEAAILGSLSEVIPPRLARFGSRSAQAQKRQTVS